jgi:hypothetical protein
MIDNPYKQLLVNKKSPINAETQISIVDELFECFIQYGKDMLYISDGFLGRVTSRKAFEVTAYQHLSSVYKDVEIKSYDEEKNRDKWNIKISDIYDTLTVRNNYDLLCYESDLFLSKQQIEKDHLTKTVTVKTNKLYIKTINELSINEDDYIEVVKDYRNHFKYFDELLDLIVDMRLAKDRKASFVHLRVKSNWGKSFLSGLLQNLGVGFEIDYHNLMNKGANDIAPIQVRNSFVMILDEFNNFSSEMKKLSHDFKFAPKFGMTEKVELYLKLLMSAEKSPSFSGGVDDQIVNRVMVMDIDDREAGRLTDRVIYKKHGNAKYMSILERYTYLKLTKKLSEYLSLEKFEAHRIADERVNEALKKYKMNDVVNLNDETKATINEEIRNIINMSDIELTPRHRDIKRNLIEINSGAYAENIFIKQPKRTIEAILKLSVSESDYKKMKWKLSDLESILNILNSKPMFINGKTQKGLVVSIKEKKLQASKEIIKDLAENGNLIIENQTAKELF